MHRGLKKREQKVRIRKAFSFATCINAIASGGYVGYCPKMPGTMGSLLGAILLFFYQPHFVSLAVLFGIAWACVYKIMQEAQSDDPQWIVIDEILGLWIAYYIYILFGGVHHIVSIIVLFLFFRVFDILKPWPIDWIESYCYQKRYSVGILLDDMIAGVFAGLLAYFALTL